MKREMPEKGCCRGRRRGYFLLLPITVFIGGFHGVGLASVRPEIHLITYNQSGSIPLTADLSQFLFHDWDGDGLPDILAVRERTGVHWHQNLSAEGETWFASGAFHTVNRHGAPIQEFSSILQDPRLGRGFALWECPKDDLRWIASIEQFARPGEIGSRSLKMHLWSHDGTEWQHVTPLNEFGEAYTIDGDVWMGPSMEVGDWTGNGRPDILIGVLHPSLAFPENQYPNSHRFPIDSFDYEAARVYLLKNITEGVEPRFSQPVMLRAGTEPIRGRGWAYPRLLDLTGNGLLDLVVGDNQPGLRVFLNKGTRGEPAMVEFGFLSNVEGNPISSTTAIIPAFADMDGDGRLDLVTTCYFGAPQFFRWFKHSGHGNLLRGWQDQGYLHYPGKADSPVIGPGISTIEMVDWDSKGVNDLLLGSEPGIPMIVRNVGTEEDRRFAPPERLRWVTGEPIELHAIEHGRGSNWGPIETHIERFLPRSGDWDGDGVPDMISGSMGMRLLWLKGVRGDNGEVRFERPRVFKLGGNEVEVAHRIQPFLIDWNRNGHLDVVAFDPWNRVTVYFGDGTEIFSHTETLLTVNEEPIQLFDGHRSFNSGRCGVAVADWTGDGRRDLLVYRRNQGCYLFQNAGHGKQERFEAEPKLLFRFFAGHNGGVTLFDWNGNGLLDILTGGGPPAHLYWVDGQTLPVPLSAK